MIAFLDDADKRINMANTWWSTYLDPSNSGRGANILAALFLSAFHTCLFVIFTFARIYAAVLRDIEFLNVLSTVLKGNNLTIRASACSFYIFTLLKVNLILLTVKSYSTFLYNPKYFFTSSLLNMAFNTLAKNYQQSL